MNIRLIDTHAHLNFSAYKDDYRDVIHRSLANEIGMINVGSQFDTSQRACELTREFPEGVYAAIGIHPIHLTDSEVDEEEVKFKTREEKFDPNKYQDLINNYKKIIAIGEIGLDYYHIPQNIDFDEYKEIQKENLLAQFEFANKNNLPVILHCRGKAGDVASRSAYLDLYNIIKKYKNKNPDFKGVVHCYVGDAEIAEKFIDMDFYIGFTGIITFGRNADYLREALSVISTENILVETDCPYLAPDPHRGKRNEPSFVENTALKISEIKNMPPKDIFHITTNNAKKLFSI